MAAQVERERKSADLPLIVLAVVLAVAGVVGFYFLTEYALPARLAALLVPVGVGLWLFSRTAPGVAALGFLRDANIEVRKVVWPTRQETLQTTGVVFVAVLISAVFLWGLDSALAFTVKTLTGRGG